MPTWLSIGSTSGTISGTPPTGTTGPLTVDFKVQDPWGGFAEQVYSLNIVTNQPPVITSIPFLGAVVSVQYVYGVTVTDPDNDSPYTFAWSTRWATWP